jgi:exopolysaccharide production protein ExoQ
MKATTFDKIENLYVKTALVCLAGEFFSAFLHGSTSQEYGESQGGIGIEAVGLFLICCLSIFFIIVRRNEIWFHLRRRGHLLGLILLLNLIVVASSLWSDLPAITLRRSILFTTTTLFGIYFGSRYLLRQQIYYLAWSLTIVSGLSLLVSVLLPSYGVMQVINAGSWRGIFLHKNGLGLAMAVALVIFSLTLMQPSEEGDHSKQHSKQHSKKQRWMTWSGLAIAFFLLLLSRSATGLTAGIVGVLTLPLYRILRFRYNLLVPVLTTLLFVVVAIATLIAIQPSGAAGLLGRDVTLTGRTFIWANVWEAIGKKPLLGYGYSGFWTASNVYARLVWQLISWKPTHPHNGLLKILLEIGWGGALVAVSLFVASFVRALQALRRTRSPEFYWPLSYLTILLLTNMTESNFLNDDFYWILYVTICLF